jgi:class 3 adenylate cyclase
LDPVAASVSGTATILYTDLVGSTEMRASIGDVEAEQVRRQHDDLLGAVVVRHNGTVVKGLGDGILAAFGSAAEAVVAAHEIQREIDRANRQARGRRGLQVRIGLSAGDVMWDDGDCHGTPVVTAARLCDVAEGGEILCDDLVRGLARGHTELRFRLVGEIELKGLPEAVVAFAVPWEPAAIESAPLPGPLRPQVTELPFAGRDAEQKRLAEAWKHAQVDGSRIALVTGEPGIGKTRLAAEIARQAHSDGALVLLGRCDEHIAAPQAPWIEAMRSLVSTVDAGVLTDHIGRCGGELTRLVPELATKVPDLPAPTVSDPDTERLLLFEAVVDILATTAAQLPVLLLIDDAHWADSGTVDLLRHLTGHLDPDARILVVITYRDTDVDRRHALARALVDLHRTPNAERILLRGLDEAEMRALLEGAGGRPLREEGFDFAHRLAEETEGNPLFVRQLLGHLIDNGTIVHRDGAWVGTVSWREAGIPEGVRDLIGQRLSRLSDETNDLLRTAAVVGREFEIDLVAAAAKVDDDTAVDLLDEAIASQLVEEVADQVGRLSFAHALVRQTLVDELSTNRRVRLHRRIAELLDERPSTPIDVLAHHYCEAATAGVASRAVACACQAAAAAGDRFAWDDALRMYERALEAIDAFDDDDPGLRSMVLARMALVEHNAGHSSRARERALRAADVARRAGDAARLTEAGVAYQGPLGMWASPSDPVAAELIREGLAGLPPDRLDARALGQAALAGGLLLAPGGAALTEADEAVAVARQADDDQALVQALLVRAWAVRGVLPAADCERAGREAVAAAQARENRYVDLASRYHVGNALLTQGDLDGAATELRLSSEYRGALEGWAIADFEASLALARGRFDEGEALSDEAHRLGTSLGDTNDGIHALQRAFSARARGDVVAAREWQARAQLTTIGSVTPLSALNALAEGDGGAARSELRAWARDVPPLLPSLMRYILLAYLGHLCFECDELDGLAAFADYADRFPGELVGNDAVIMGAADVARGQFRAVQGRLDEALPLIEAGHDLHQRLGLRALEVESGLALGSVLLRRGRTDDGRHGLAVLDSTAGLAASLGMPLLEAKARRLMT